VLVALGLAFRNIGMAQTFSPQVFGPLGGLAGGGLLTNGGLFARPFSGFYNPYLDPRASAFGNGVIGVAG
jgi:hypothetical protein